MIQLYHGGGATGFELTSAPLGDDELLKLKSAVTRLLEARNQHEEAGLLQAWDFQLSEGTNYFADEFLVLHAKVSIEEYVGLVELMKDPDSKRPYHNIAAGFLELGRHVRFIAIFPDTDNVDPFVPPPSPKITSATVERALKDAENLLQSSGPVSAVDRVHTAIHGYLKAICDEEGIGYASDESLTQLFGLVRERHPRFQPAGPHDPDVVRILRSTAAILESVNTLRNRASVAHPNEDLLGEAEAILFINSVRTLLHYLDAKIKK